MEINFVSRIHEPGRDPGFGQSILHEGQLIFHTPPYGSQDISLQEPINGWDGTLGNSKTAARLKVSDIYFSSITY